MESIYAILGGLGLRFALSAITRLHSPLPHVVYRGDLVSTLAAINAASKSNLKVVTTLIGLWEGVVTSHFLKKMPHSWDPYIAYGVRLFIDIIVTESVERLVLVVIWTVMGMILADVAPPIWREMGLHRIWRRTRRELYTITRTIEKSVPKVALGVPRSRTVRFSGDEQQVREREERENERQQRRRERRGTRDRAQRDEDPVEETPSILQPPSSTIESTAVASRRRIVPSSELASILERPTLTASSSISTSSLTSLLVSTREREPETPKPRERLPMSLPTPTNTSVAQRPSRPYHQPIHPIEYDMDSEASRSPSVASTNDLNFEVEPKSERDQAPPTRFLSTLPPPAPQSYLKPAYPTDYDMESEASRSPSVVSTDDLNFELEPSEDNRDSFPSFSDFGFSPQFSSASNTTPRTELFSPPQSDAMSYVGLPEDMSPPHGHRLQFLDTAIDNAPEVDAEFELMSDIAAEEEMLAIAGGGRYNPYGEFDIEEEVATPRARNDYLPPTPSDSATWSAFGARRNANRRELPPLIDPSILGPEESEEEVPVPPTATLQWIPDEKKEAEVKVDRAPTPPPKDEPAPPPVVPQPVSEKVKVASSSSTKKKEKAMSSIGVRTPAEKPKKASKTKSVVSEGAQTPQLASLTRPIPDIPVIASVASPAPVPPPRSVPPPVAPQQQQPISVATAGLQVPQTHVPVGIAMITPISADTSAVIAPPRPNASLLHRSIGVPAAPHPVSILGGFGNPGVSVDASSEIGFETGLPPSYRDWTASVVSEEGTDDMYLDEETSRRETQAYMNKLKEQKQLEEQAIKDFMAKTYFSQPAQQEPEPVKEKEKERSAPSTPTRAAPTPALSMRSPISPISPISPYQPNYSQKVPRDNASSVSTTPRERKVSRGSVDFSPQSPVRELISSWDSRVQDKLPEVLPGDVFGSAPRVSRSELGAAGGRRRSGSAFAGSKSAIGTGTLGRTSVPRSTPTPRRVSAPIATPTTPTRISPIAAPTPSAISSYTPLTAAGVPIPDTPYSRTPSRSPSPIRQDFDTMREREREWELARVHVPPAPRDSRFSLGTMASHDPRFSLATFNDPRFSTATSGFSLESGDPLRFSMDTAVMEEVARKALQSAELLLKEREEETPEEARERRRREDEEEEERREEERLRKQHEAEKEAAREKERERKRQKAEIEAERSRMLEEVEQREREREANRLAVEAFERAEAEIEERERKEAEAVELAKQVAEARKEAERAEKARKEAEAAERAAIEAEYMEMVRREAEAAEAEREFLVQLERDRAAEEERVRLKAEKEAKEAEERRQVALAEERRLREEEEARRKAEEEEARRKAVEEEARRKAVEEEARRKAAEEEEERRKAVEEEERLKVEAETKAREEEEAKRKLEEEEEAKRKAAEEQARQEEEERLRLEAEARAKQEEEQEALRLAALELAEKQKKTAEEEEKRLKKEEKARKKAARKAEKAAEEQRLKEEAEKAAEEERLKEEAELAEKLRLELEAQDAERARLAEEEAERERQLAEAEAVKAKQKEEEEIRARELKEQEQQRRWEIEEAKRNKELADEQERQKREEETKKAALALAKEKELPPPPSEVSEASRRNLNLKIDQDDPWRFDSPEVPKTPTQETMNLAGIGAGGGSVVSSMIKPGSPTPLVEIVMAERKNVDEEEEEEEDYDALNARPDDLMSVSAATEVTEVCQDIEDRLHKMLKLRAQKAELEAQIDALRAKGATDPMIKDAERVVRKYGKKINRLYADCCDQGFHYSEPPTNILLVGTDLEMARAHINEALIWHIDPASRAFSINATLPPAPKKNKNSGTKAAIIKYLKDDLNIEPIVDKNNGRLITLRIDQNEFDDWVADFRRTRTEV